MIFGSLKKLFMKFRTSTAILEFVATKVGQLEVMLKKVSGMTLSRYIF